MNITINQNTNFGSHNTSTRNDKIEYIVIHYVGATGDAKANINYYNQKSTTSASADFYVGHNGDIWQYNPDPGKRYCWAVGGKKQSSYGGSLYGIAKNANCVSIEMCVKNNGNKSANSVDWILTNETYSGTLLLTKYLMEKYNIPVERVIRHNDVNGKACPGIIGWNAFPGNNESRWTQFKNDLVHKATLQSAQEILKKALKIIDGNGETLEDAKNELQAALKIDNTNASTNHSGIKELPSKTVNKIGFNQNIKDLQIAINKDNITGAKGRKLVEDGVWGKNTASAVAKVLLSTKTNGKYIETTAWVQCRVGAEPDGLFGNKTKDKVMNFQNDNKLTVDGVVGNNTMIELVRMYVPSASF